MFFAGLVLLEMKYISIVAVNEFGNRRVQSFAVWALHEKNGTVLQGWSPGGQPILFERKQSTATAFYYFAGRTGAVIRGM
jgi:hypothetical protein